MISWSLWLSRLVLGLVPGPIGLDLIAQYNADGDVQFVADQIRRYLEADDAGRSGILAFHVGGGVEMFRQAKRKAEAEADEEERRKEA